MRSVEAPVTRIKASAFTIPTDGPESDGTLSWDETTLVLMEAMVSLRFRPEWFKARSVLGYGVDWSIDWREMWTYYARAEQVLSISGPVHYPWGPKRPRYPYCAHPINAAGAVLARGAEALGMDWTPTPLATVSAPRGRSPPCVYRGFCRFGCSTNAKQSALIVWIPRALKAGTSVVDADCRCWDVRNLWVYDGSVFPTVGGVNPSLTIQALALRTADRIEALAGRGELSG